MVSKMASPSNAPPSPPTSPTSPGSAAAAAAAAASASDKLCAVCGDRALGYNFNAVTCESCKAFFRRNALAAKPLHCPFSERCDITVVTRRFCQRCRLVKCFAAGMRKEYIMSEEDKILKKIKIEQNRTKRKPPSTTTGGSAGSSPQNGDRTQMRAKIKREVVSLMRSGEDEDSDETAMAATVAQQEGSRTLQQPQSMHQQHTATADAEDVDMLEAAAPSKVFISSHVSSSSCESPERSTSANATGATTIPPMPTLASSSTAIVDRLVHYPEDSSKLINHLMKTPNDAVLVMTKIINSQKDAMRLIGHLIGSPGDALKIISKIMNSPFDALTVFTKFMSSPTDALEIIAKIASSPGEVLQFIQQLMNSPEDALQIMNKFMNSPAEALKMLNQMVNNPGVDSTTTTTTTTATAASGSHPMIESMLSDVRPAEASSGGASPLTTERKACDDKQTGAEQQTKPPPSSPPSSSGSERIREILEAATDEPILANTLEAVICDAISMEYDLDRTPAGLRELNDAERAKLNELIVANKALYAPLDEDLSELAECSGDSNGNPPQLLKIINLTAIAIRRLIKMSKKINAFRNMCQEDQVALLKGGCTEMMILRSAMQFDSAQATWRVNTRVPNSQEAMSSITVDVLKLAKGRLYEVHDAFIRTFDARWRHDENIILILSAIVLFTPDRPRTVHRDVLQLEQNSYYYLLRRYLESVCGGCEAKSTFLKLVQKIRDLQQLKDAFVGVYLDVNPQQVEPLLWEMFDLKNHC